MADELNSRPMTDSVTPRIPILGPYPAFMTSSPHFPSLLSKPRFVDLPSQAHEAMYICAYRFAAQLAGSDTATKQEKMAMLTWLRDLATEVYGTSCDDTN